jgi:hypothetical protein
MLAFQRIIHQFRLYRDRFPIWIHLASGCAVAVTTFPITLMAAPLPQLAVDIVGTFEVVFDWKTERCDRLETVDAPPRAFRDANGGVHLIASHDIWREFVGRSLDTVKFNCRIQFRSARNEDPSMFSDYEWLVSPYTIDGKHVDALVHNEYHPVRNQYHPNIELALCPSRRYEQCWSNNLTYVHSEDGGKSYIRPSPPANFVAGLPYAYRADVGFPIGYMQPSNIVKFDGFYYALFSTPAYLQQESGTCIMRTNDLSNPGSWRAWDGHGFSISFANPYVDQIASTQGHLCKPLPTKLGVMGGMARDPASGAFILVTKGGVSQPGAPPAIGIVALASFDLISWSNPVLIWRDPSGVTSAGDLRATDSHPSLLDPMSSSRNFDVLGGMPYVYFVRDNPAARPYDRKLMRVQVRMMVSRNP